MRIGSERVHLIGVGGAGMSALARLLHGIGADLTGSDSGGTEMVEELRSEGIPIWTGHRPEAIRGENGYAIHSAAVPDDDPEILECRRRNFTVLLYADAVGRLSEGKRTLAIGGTHGKTTTTGLTGAALRGAGLDPSHIIGGSIPELGGNGYGGRDDLFVVEACEFNRSFHALSPFAAAILNLDHDHFDCYPSREDLHAAFAGYVARVRPTGTVLVEEDVAPDVLEDACKTVRVLRVGQGLFADIRAVSIDDDLGRYSFVPIVEGRRLPRVQLAQPGRFQVQNALFALGLCDVVGADLEGACEGISKFAGVRRRFEIHHGSRGGTVVNDYAHHPAEIRAVIRAARRRYPGQPLFVVFQPHQHRRTLHLLDEFAEALSEADHCLVAEIYAARESAEIRAQVGHEDLVEAIRARGTRCDAAGPLDRICDRIAALRHPRDLVLVLGAGDIDSVVDGVVAVV